MRRARTWVCLLAAAFLLAGAAALALGDLREPASSQAKRSVRGIPAMNGLKACPGDGRTGFANYWLGARFADLPLKAVLRDCQRPVRGEPFPGRLNVITYVYGDCKVPDIRDGGCLPPLEVTSAPACEDNLSLYSRYPDESGRPPPHRRLTIRGVPAASFDGGRQLELYAGRTTITVAGNSPRRIREAARTLRSSVPGLRVRLNAAPRVNRGVAAVKAAASRARSSGLRSPRAVSAGERMPPVAKGALAGKLRC